MKTNNIITSIDIGSSKIRTIIWSFNDENNKDFNVLGIWISDSKAIRKWNILDMEEFKDNLDKSLEEAEKMSWEQVFWVYLSFNSSSFDVVSSKWIIAVPWEDITQEDIDRVLDMAKNWVDLPNREILKIVPEYFIVDLEDGVTNPIWMSARKLEVVAHIFSMNKNILNNIKKAVSDVWIEIYDVFPNLLASPEWVLTKRQKELWVVCVDIGASTTWVTIYEEGVLQYSTVIPIWWDNVTNDIALWLRTSIDIAERLKVDYSELWVDDSARDEEIDLVDLWSWEEWKVSKLYLSKIITARYEEILFFVKEELIAAGKDGMLPEWVVLVWWWVKELWLIDIVKDILKLPAFIWIPIEKEDMLLETSISDPIFASVIWNMILANKYIIPTNTFSLNIWWFFASILKVLKKILPK